MQPLAVTRRTVLLSVSAAITTGVSACATAPAGQRPLPASTVPAVDGQWMRLPASPLSARGDALAIWTGQQLLLLGGRRTDAVNAPCPAAASCTGPPQTAFGDAAAWDPDSGTWTHLRSDIPDDPDGVGLLDREPGVWSGTQVLTRFSAFTPDLAAGTLTHASIDAGDGLVYADPVWTGDRLVLVAGAPSGPGSGPAGVVQAQVYDPATAAVRQVPWPFGPQGASETLLTTWTGQEVIAFVTIAPKGGEGYCRTAAFDPASEVWRLISDELPVTFSVAWDGQRVRIVDGDRLVSVDVSSGATTSSPLPDSGADRAGSSASVSSGRLLASPAGRLLLLGQRRYVLGPVAGAAGGGVDADAWRRLPEPPTGVVTTAQSVAWAGERVVLWGGMGPGIKGEAGVNTDEGWAFDVVRQGPVCGRVPLPTVLRSVPLLDR